jgi:hypothetical protein
MQLSQDAGILDMLVDGDDLAYIFPLQLQKQVLTHETRGPRDNNLLSCHVTYDSNSQALSP